MQPLISVVSPVYKAENIVEELVIQIIENVKSITDNFEIVLVCDGSPDASWEKIKECCKQNSFVKGINLIRLPNLHTPIIMSITPAISVAITSPEKPFVAIIPATIEANAAVGPAI